MNQLSTTLLVGGIAILALPDSPALAQGSSLPLSQVPTSAQATTKDPTPPTSASKKTSPATQGVPLNLPSTAPSASEVDKQTQVPAPEETAQDKTPSQVSPPSDSAAPMGDEPQEKPEAPLSDGTVQSRDQASETSQETAVQEQLASEEPALAPSVQEASGREPGAPEEEHREELSASGRIEETFRAEGTGMDLDSEDPDAAKNRALMGEELDREIERITDQAVTQAMAVQGDNDAPEADQAVDQAITEAVDEALAKAAEKSDQTPYHTPGTHQNEVNHLRNLRATGGLSGGTGLLRTESAILGSNGTVRLSLMGEAFEQKGFPQNGTSVTHLGGSFGANLVFLRYFEGFFAYKIASDYVETKGVYDLSQSLGDFRFGVKGASQVFHGFYLGGALKFSLLPGFGADWSGGDIGFNFSPEIIASWDARTVHRDVPLVLHLNLGAVFSNQDKVYDVYTPSAFDEFALSMNRYSQLTLAFGVEIPLPYVTPYAEWNMALPITAAAIHDFSGQKSSTSDAMANRLAIGGKITALPDVTFTVGFEFGLNNKVAQGIAATPAFMFHFGLSYAFDPLMNHQDEEMPFVDLPPVAMAEDVPAVVLPPEEASDAPQKEEVAQDKEGDTEAAPEDSSADGVQAQAPPPALDNLEHGETAEVQGVSDAVAPPADGSDVEGDAPKPRVRALGADGQAVAIKLLRLDDPTEAFELTQEGTVVDLKPGSHSVVVVQEGKLAWATTLEIPEIQGGGEKINPIEIHVGNAKARPKSGNVSVSLGELKLSKKIAFTGQSSKLRISSQKLIDEIADLMLLGTVKRLRVEAHTDFPRKANPDTLMALSKARAESVKAALVARGVPEKRIEAAGFGGTKPIKPNGLAKGREMNRRVEFKVLK